MSKYVLGIDIGSTMAKASVFDLAGKELGVSTAACDLLTPQPGWYERDMEGIWQTSAQAVKHAIGQSGVAPGAIACVSLTGHGNGAHLVDAQGHGVRNSIEGSDNRAAAYVEAWQRDGSLEKIHPMNMQALWPALSLCVMAWLRDNAPDTLQKARYWLNVKDYVRMRLTGEAYLEFSDATGSGLINTRDRKIDREMLDIVGLGFVADLLPPLRYATDGCGRVTKEAAALTGLAEGTPVAAGCYDIDAAGLATGLTDDRYLNVIVGSWANNQFIAKTPVVAASFFSTTVYAVQGYYLMLEGSPTSASNLEWLVNRFLPLERERAKAEGTSVYALCNEAVAQVPPDASDIVFLPFLYGSNVHPAAHGALLGMEGWHTRAHVLRAVYEGICFSHRWHIEKMAKYRALPGVVRMAGGAARSAAWRQMFADVLNRPVETTRATELGTLGAAMCAAVSVGAYPDVGAAADAMVALAEVSRPDPRAVKIYDAKYRRYLRALAALDGYWGAANERE